MWDMCETQISMKDRDGCVVPFVLLSRPHGTLTVFGQSNLGTFEQLRRMRYHHLSLSCTNAAFAELPSQKCCIYLRVVLTCRGGARLSSCPALTFTSLELKPTPCSGPDTRTSQPSKLMSPPSTTSNPITISVATLSDLPDRALRRICRHDASSTTLVDPKDCVTPN